MHRGVEQGAMSLFTELRMVGLPQMRSRGDLRVATLIHFLRLCQPPHCVGGDWTMCVCVKCLIVQGSPVSHVGAGETMCKYI